LHRNEKKADPEKLIFVFTISYIMPLSQQILILINWEK